MMIPLIPDILTKAWLFAFFTLKQQEYDTLIDEYEQVESD